MNQDEYDSRFVGYLSHYLVSLGCVSVSSRLIPPANERKFFTSGFVIELDGSWYLVTAGHVFNAIRDYLAGHPQKTHTFVVHAGLGTFSLNRDLIPFDYRDPVFSVDRPGGLDFGAIQLSAAERATLRGNGVVAVEEGVWDQDLPQQFSEFALLGLPEQNMDLETPGEASIQPVFLRVESVDGVPSEYVHHTDRMRYFRVMEPSRPDLNISGMGGCPVFAFRQQEGRDVRAVVCAMQKSWLPTQRVLATCDLWYAGNLLRQAVLSSQGPGQP
jgi:hypothetical protein